MKEKRSGHKASVIDLTDDLMSHCEASGVLISGGHSSYGSLQSVEIYNPATNTTCSLPQLPEVRYYHTQDGELACGGRTHKRTCVKWNSDSGSWTKFPILRHRVHHVSWATEDGVYLMGG